MSSSALARGKVICFHCRRSDCIGPCRAAPRRLRISAELMRGGVWLGGACVAGGVFGAVLALLLGG
jgi:hypothetical protein